MASEIPKSSDVAPPANAESLFERVKNIVPGMVAGSLKGSTTDLLGLPVDIINQALGSVGLSSKKPVGGSDSLRSLFGIKSQSEDTSAEVGGSFISPAGAAKAMIVGAARVLKKEGLASEAISKIMQTAQDAQAMDMAGVKASVFQNTGVYVGKEGKARAAISDISAKTDPEYFYKNMKTGALVPESSNLSDILRHDELFSIYPELKDYKVRHNPELGLGEAMHFPESRVIEMGPQSSFKSAKEVLLHETQHAVQKIEDFINGGTAKEFLKIPRPGPEKLASIKAMTASSDASLASSAQRFLETINADARQAHQKYLDIPGETEARFTQQSTNLSSKELNSKIYNLISEDTPTSLWAK